MQQSVVRLNDDPSLPDFLPFQQQLHFERFVASQNAGLRNLYHPAATFESVKCLLNLCDPHSIISKHLLNLTNCFTWKITKILTKNLMQYLCSSYSVHLRNKNPANTCNSTTRLPPGNDRCTGTKGKIQTCVCIKLLPSQVRFRISTVCGKIQDRILFEQTLYKVHVMNSDVH
ncbi:hypothetical protein TNCV_2678731 [Trichonephila clavipes]|nr:hypothetical protein TNCV_2678731 [Trichonephila clavipes]